MDLLTDPEFQKVLQTLANEIGDALPKVMNNARDTLKKHIDEDVYSESVYTPEVYKRRSDNAALGISLAAQVYQEPYTKILSPAAALVGRRFHVTTRIYYNPSGSHKKAIWSSGEGKRPKWVVNLDHNELIRRIEKKDPAYNWGQSKVPPRPFWQNFVDDMVDGGELEKSFVDAMRASGNRIEADGNITEEASDRNTD